MKASALEILENLIARYTALRPIRQELIKAAEIMVDTYQRGGKILVCGNGGSCSDADHIVGELMKSFVKSRPMTQQQKELFSEYPQLAERLQRCIPAISLCAHSALMTAYANDESPELVFAQQVFGYLKPEDTLIAISTSGNSKNVVNAARAAKCLKGRVIAMTGPDQCQLAQFADALLAVGQHPTYQVQELHLPIYHALCLMLEEEIF